MEMQQCNFIFCRLLLLFLFCELTITFFLLQINQSGAQLVISSRSIIMMIIIIIVKVLYNQTKSGKSAEREGPDENQSHSSSSFSSFLFIACDSLIPKRNKENFLNFS